MYENRLPDAQLELVQEIDTEGEEDIEAHGPQLLAECVLDRTTIERRSRWSYTTSLTAAGAKPSESKRSFTAFDLTARRWP